MEMVMMMPSIASRREIRLGDLISQVIAREQRRMPTPNHMMPASTRSQRLGMAGLR